MGTPLVGTPRVGTPLVWEIPIGKFSFKPVSQAPKGLAKIPLEDLKVLRGLSVLSVFQREERFFLAPGFTKGEYNVP